MTAAYNSPMNERVELIVGRTPWPVDIPAEKRIALHRTSPPQDGASSTARTPREMMRAALERPLGVDAPLFRALTPDDQVAIVIDESVPCVGEMLAELLAHVSMAGVNPEAVTLLVAPPSGSQPWVDDLPEEFEVSRIEVHDPTVQEKLSYLATTQAGRRIYLNRTLVQADFVAVLSGRRFHPSFGHAGAELALFPTLSDAETRAAVAQTFDLDPPAGKKNALTSEAEEVVWQLGMPAFFQAIEGYGDTIAEVVGGLSTRASAEGAKRQDAHWRGRVTSNADLVIATVSGDPAKVRFGDLAAAVACARRVLNEDGRLLLLTEAGPELGEAGELLRVIDKPAALARRLAARKPDDPAPAAHWAYAAHQVHLFVAADWPDELIEELFATPLRKVEQVQRLIDAAETVLVIHDAHKRLVEVGV